MNSFKRILLISKITGLENLKINFNTLDTSNIKIISSHYQKNLESLIKRHNEHHRFVHTIIENLTEFKKELQVVKKDSYTEKHAEWADLIVSAGGDGTFLNAASRVHDMNKPILGLNTDPLASAGYLCLSNIKSNDLKAVFSHIFSNDYQTLYRTRMRTIIVNPSWSNDHGRIKSLYSTHSENSENIFSQVLSPDKSMTLRLKALNEVFAGESSSAKVSQYEIKIDDGPTFEKQKSSGAILYTGTGSSSWAYHINRVSEGSMRRMLEIMRTRGLVKDEAVGLNTEDLVCDLCREFNDDLLLPQDSTKIGYIIRDGVINRKFKITNDQGFGSKVTLISMMKDGYLAIDGSFGVPFNNGTKAEFTIHPEDSLKCIFLT